ncbi:TniQ family protein [Methyloradius palustris]|uniref:TniQ domain-containing protein n=1 Tax=Methyloradius palustris TaxID=2778876 RepID=A0A8E3ZI58_9PROT|nr:TniQ family protein [Methyloradius palustris]BCM26198.1 hypothetical protein ZMTM_24570 [Methyloradius palustris]
MDQISLDAICPLVSTPESYHGESYMGFMLRTAEDNGYASVHAMMRYAGLTENEMRAARPPIAKLSSLFGREVSEFESMDTDAGVKSGRHMTLMKHHLPSIYLRSKHARICPDCVAEHGHVSAFWELKHAVACTAHKRMALERCPDCKMTIDWSRRGLKTCRCGLDFSYVDSEIVSNQALLTLLELLQAKLRREPLNHDALHYLGFPVDALEKLSLNTLLGIINRLENFLQTTRTQDDDLALPAMENTAEILANWPQGFYRYLERVHAPNAQIEASGLRGQFKSFYESFFKNELPPEEMAFLHEAFVAFGKQHWQQASIHPNLAKDYGSNIVGIEGLAKAIGKQPSTTRKLVDQGLIPVHSLHPRTGRKLFNLSQMPFEFAEGKALSLDTAAEILDIPVTVLRAYRARGFYHAQYLVSPSTLFHERDVAELKNDLVRDCVRLDSIDELHQITLNKVMLKKLGDPIVKASFIAAIKNREIKPLGMLSDTVGSLVLELKTVKDYLDHFSTVLADSVSLEDAKTELVVDHEVIAELLKHGLIESMHTEVGPRITRQSLTAFCSQYVPCRKVAKLKAIPQQQVLDLCGELGILPFHIREQNLRPKDSFLPRERLSLLGIDDFVLIDQREVA